MKPRVRFSLATIWLLVAMAIFYTWIAYVLLNCVVVIADVEREPSWCAQPINDNDD